MKPNPKHPPFRALTAFMRLPAKHKTFRCHDDDHEPHIHAGEWIVVDTADRAPQHGEIYLIRFRSGEFYAKQVNIARGIEIFRRRVPKDDRLWWLDSARKFYNTGTTTDDGIPLFAGLSDGPYQTHNLRKMLIGRVVGVACSSLGRPINTARVEA